MGARTRTGLAAAVFAAVVLALPAPEADASITPTSVPPTAGQTGTCSCGGPTTGQTTTATGTGTSSTGTGTSDGAQGAAQSSVISSTSAGSSGTASGNQSASATNGASPAASGPGQVATVTPGATPPVTPAPDPVQPEAKPKGGDVAANQSGTPPAKPQGDTPPGGTSAGDGNQGAPPQGAAAQSALATSTVTPAPKTDPVPERQPDVPATPGPARSETRRLGPLAFGLPSATPGGEATATGAGCAPGEPVVLTVDGRPAGRDTAGSDGTFRARVQVPPDLALGPRAVAASCGPLTLAGPLDLVVSSATPTTGFSTTAALLAFFVLLGLVVAHPLRGTPTRKAALS
jgi:hypothetical protein